MLTSSLVSCDLFNKIIGQTTTTTSTQQPEPPVSSNPLDNGVAFGKGIKDPAYENAVDNGGLLKLLSSVPEYKDNGEIMYISYMWGPRANDETMKIMADLGITVTQPGSYSEYLAQVPYLEQYNMYATPHIEGENPLQLEGYHPNNISDRIIGFNWKDEPYYDYILNTLSENVQTHKENYDGKIFYSNLNPCWDGNENQPGPDGEMYGGLDYTGYVATYADYILPELNEKYRFMSIDIYPLLENGLTIRNDWLYTYENLAEYTKAYGGILHFYLCSTHHYGYRYLNDANLRFMVNVAMAYGGTAMSYFQYASSYKNASWGTALTDDSGLEIYDAYYSAQKINKECLAWDHIFMNFKWDELMCLTGTTISHNSSQYSRLKFNVDEIDIVENVTSSMDALISRFTGVNNEIGLMVTNFTDPDVVTSNNEIVMQLKEANKAIIYINGVREVVDLDNHTLKLSLKPGEAAFVIPLEIAE